ncbi:MAG: hypothetical protein LBK94_01465 [Prevotellaceae bacterium]|jgi:hypothetical protein|nr:hypothetical protein [Prevotellaceae bacterium]
MKKHFLLLLLVFGFIKLMAQDIIVKHDSVEISAVVTEIGDTEIKYRQSGRDVVYTVGRQDVFMIKYENGTKDVFAEKENTPENNMEQAYAYPYPPVSRTYAAGDYFNEGGIQGIVFYVTDNGQHGLIVSLQELGASSNSRGLLQGLGVALSSRGFWYHYTVHGSEWNFVVNATDLNDGWQNKLKIEDCISKTELTYDNFPAFKLCSDLGNGWYLPSYNELKKLFMCFNGGQEYGANFESQKMFNAQLRQAKGKPLSGESYRSSTEYDIQYAYSINFSGWEMDNNLLTKRGNAMVRAVHKF